MKNLFALLVLLAGGSVLALSGTTPSVARLYAQPHEHGGVTESLAPKTKIEIKTCTGGPKGWCAVSVGKKQGWIPRAQIKASGNCAALRAVGLGDLRPGEASYNRQRDRDGDGLGCDKTGE